jgi:hypothetical protein
MEDLVELKIKNLIKKTLCPSVTRDTEINPEKVTAPSFIVKTEIAKTRYYTP